MKNIMMKNEMTKKTTIMQAWRNQHPIMLWWFAISIISLCSVYVMLLTKF